MPGNARQCPGEPENGGHAMRVGIYSCGAILAVLLLGNTVLAQNYVTDIVCEVCHSGHYDDYMQSGHPYKVTHTGGLVPGPDTWPFTPNPWLPAGLDWADVEYVIGNYFWKARVIDRNGYIYTGDDAQFNISTQGQSAYHAEILPGTKPFDCGRCHTTGYDNSDPNVHQLGLPGLIGTWVQDGIRCEACHGPGGDHVDAFGAVPVPRELAGGIPQEGDNWKDCDECHYRDEDFRMPFKGGFMRHHQQGEDFSHSPHSWFPDGCMTCHNPHRSTVYGLGGSIAHCTDCHAESEHQVEGMEFLDCTDCHMSKMGKSGTAERLADGSPHPYRGDVRTHLFRIMDEPIAKEDNVTDGFWNQDPEIGRASCRERV